MSVADALTFICKSYSHDPVAGFGPTGNTSQVDWFAPCTNPSVFRIMNWFYCLESLSFNSLNELVKTVLLAPDFNKTHLENFDASQEAQHLDGEAIQKSQQPLPFNTGDHWKEEEVKVPLPMPGISYKSEDDAPHIMLSLAY